MQTGIIFVSQERRADALLAERQPYLYTVDKLRIREMTAFAMRCHWLTCYEAQLVLYRLSTDYQEKSDNVELLIANDSPHLSLWSHIKLEAINIPAAFACSYDLHVADNTVFVHDLWSIMPDELVDAISDMIDLSIRPAGHDNLQDLHYATDLITDRLKKRPELFYG